MKHKRQIQLALFLVLPALQPLTNCRAKSVSPISFTSLPLNGSRTGYGFLLTANYTARAAPADLPKGAKWVYDHPFFIILNVAVGGGWPGNPDATTIFPQTMLVDYVRVYDRAEKSSK